jgi:hypothetical protein
MKLDSNATLASAPSPELPGGQGEQSLELTTAKRPDSAIPAVPADLGSGVGRLARKEENEQENDESREENVRPHLRLASLEAVAALDLA